MITAAAICAALATVLLCVFYLLMIFEGYRNEPPIPTIKHYPKYNRYEQRRKNGGKHTDQEWRDLCQAFNYRCAKCGRQSPLTKDHVIPLVRGGSDAINNIQPLCRPCNLSKGTKAIDYRARHIQSCPARIQEGN